MPRKKKDHASWAALPAVVRSARRIKDMAAKKLLAWYDRTARDLPWRRTHDPYRIWVSEIMLQQTQVETVLPFYRRFVAAFPTIRTLARASEDEVLKRWEGLGYYSRARHLQEAARMVEHELHGRLPRQVPELLCLPGIGAYTAGAIASIAFGEQAPVVDANIKRVIARLFGVRDSLGRPGVVRGLWHIAACFLPARRPGD
ncbi:A/G-specific adenine glycosylase, partial [candidate division FCPU426 bacterium]|nr:A/G-specific adenine glycosylase [candidate division FCPU426 bacterium]